MANVVHSSPGFLHIFLCNLCFFLSTSSELSACVSGRKGSKAESDKQAVLKSFMLLTDYYATVMNPDFLSADNQADIKLHRHIFT